MAKVIAFRSMLGLLLIVLLSAQTCTEQGSDYQLDKDNSISLEIPMFPSQFSTHYLMDKDVLYVHLINRISKTDSVISQATMDSASYKEITELITELDKTEYINACVSDGQSYTVVLNQESKDQVKVRFENTYHENLDKIIQSVNTKLEADLKIYFDKATLEALPTECD